MMIKSKFNLLIVFITAITTSKLKSDYKITFQKLVDRSNHFNRATKFPTINNRISAIAGHDEHKKLRIASQAEAVSIIAHPRIISLINMFLKYKVDHGTSKEKKLYEGMSLQTFIDRLLTKRPLMFMTKDDSYLLRNGASGSGGFERIGKEDELSPLVLAEYLSYDEMQIAALLGVSVQTFFINNGSRENRATINHLNNHQQEGIYVGLVGARFEIPGLMEWQHMIISKDQNSRLNGYGINNIGIEPSIKSGALTKYWHIFLNFFHKKFKNKPSCQLLNIWEKFYDEKFPTFDEAQNDTTGKYLPIDSTTYLNTSVYKKRLKMVIEPFLKEADKRGKDQLKKVYCHVVGLGLGVWQISPMQAQIMMDAYAEVIKEHHFPYISDINFSYFPKDIASCLGASNLGVLKINHNNITIHFSLRNPADKLIDADSEKLLVAMYAWDGNAYPGNEYWAGMLNACGDPAAACCSTIAELQNPLINWFLTSAKFSIK